MILLLTRLIVRYDRMFRKAHTIENEKKSVAHTVQYNGGVPKWHTPYIFLWDVFFSQPLLFQKGSLLLTTSPIVREICNFRKAHAIDVCDDTFR